MYQLEPPVICVFEHVLEDEHSAASIERMLAAIGRDLSSAERVTDADIPDMIERHGWRDSRLRQGKHNEHAEPALVFTLHRGKAAPEIEPVLAQCPDGTPASLVGNLLGHGGAMLAGDRSEMGLVCRPRVQFDTIYGCPHGCKYCSGGKVAIIFANVEEFIEREVVPYSEANPWQKVFMFNSCLTDTLCFEPEYGISELLAEYYASTPDQHYLIHTKSANVDFLRDVDHRGRIIVLWSLTSETASRLVEPGSATMEERIEAARKCQEAGYTVRYKFKPIVPVRGWREECERMMDLAFAQTRPDNIGLFTLAWMNADEFGQIIDPALLDPAFVAAAEESADEMRGVAAGPFPHEARAEIYDFYLREIRRHDSEVPVFLCTETPAMWADFAPRLGLTAGDYVCGCGPQSPPGTRRLEYVGAPVEAV
ncbi:MAG: hypothetical protein J7M38_14775 [Armatimonadetes bacterium]|nr:hypothetical protein [Armatimonadota bacterium]